VHNATSFFCASAYEIGMTRPTSPSASIPARYQVISFPFTGMTGGHNVCFHGTNYRTEENQYLNLFQ